LASSQGSDHWPFNRVKGCWITDRGHLSVVSREDEIDMKAPIQGRI
jgi:hypothetical protein